MGSDDAIERPGGKYKLVWRINIFEKSKSSEKVVPKLKNLWKSSNVEADPFEPIRLSAIEAAIVLRNPSVLWGWMVRRWWLEGDDIVGDLHGRWIVADEVGSTSLASLPTLNQTMTSERHKRAGLFPGSVPHPIDSVCTWASLAISTSSLAASSVSPLSCPADAGQPWSAFGTCSTVSFVSLPSASTRTDPSRNSWNPSWRWSKIVG